MTESIPLKQCSRKEECIHPLGSWQPATTEYFRKASKEKSGLTSRCKACLHKGDAVYREENPEHGKEWYEDNKDQVNARRRAEYEADPEKYREIARANYWADPERARQLSMERYYKNPKKYKEYRDKQYEKMRNDPELWAAELLRIREHNKQHPERRRAVMQKSDAKRVNKRREYGREYDKRFPEKVRAKSHKRMALKKQVGGSYTAEDLIRLYDEQEGRCGYCGQSIYWSIPRDIHVDHIHPLSKGGSNNPDNLTLTCHYCNESKGDKLLTEWMSTRGW